MDLKFYLALGLCIALTDCLDFSQFYLPQCCYIPPNVVAGANNVAASNSNPAFRHGVKARKAEPAQVIRLDSDQPLLKSGTNVTETVTTPGGGGGGGQRRKKIAARLFRYIIPIEKEKKPQEPNSNEGSEDAEDEARARKVYEEVKDIHRKKVRKIFQRSELNAHVDKILLSSAQIEKELQPGLNGSVPAVQVLFSPNQTTDSDDDTAPKFKRNAGRTKAESEEARRSKNDTYGAKMNKVPSSWMINLRRALYQSIDTMISNNNKRAAKAEAAETDGGGETLQTKSSSYSPNQRSSAEVNRITELWRHLRNANFSMIEPLSRSASTIPQDVFSPTGEGPVASGVVVNTLNGIQLRMASELYFPQDDPNAAQSNNNGGCNCHLINNGEILMAYWSVSRIQNEDGDPALQYLIYPLPHNVPTPPRMIPFNSQNYGPASSPYDPQTNYQQDYSKLQNLPGPHGQLAHTHLSQSVNAYQSPAPGSQYHGQGQQQQYNTEETPTYLQEVPLDTPQQHQHSQKQLAYPPKYEEALKNLQYFNQIPDPAAPVDDRQGYRGILIHNQHGYTPEFLELYKQAVANHLNQKDQQYVNNNGPSHLFPPQAPVPPPGLEQVYGSKQPLIPPAHLQLFDGQGPGFPKSIQDILSPIPGTPFLAGPGVSVSPSPLNPADFLGAVNFNPDFQSKLPPGLSRPPGPESYQGVVNYGHRQNFEQQQQQVSPIDIPPGFKLGNVYRFDHQSGGDFPGNLPSGPPPPPPIEYDDERAVVNHHSLLPQDRPPSSQPHYPQHDHHPDDKRYNPERKPYYHDRNPLPLPPPSPPRRPYRPPQSSYPNSNEDDIRYHRSQSSSTRHRSEKYGRPGSSIAGENKRLNPDGSYIINF